MGSLRDELDNMLTAEGQLKRQSDLEMDPLAARGLTGLTDDGHGGTTGDEREEEIAMGAHCAPSRCVCLRCGGLVKAGRWVLLCCMHHLLLDEPLA